MFSTNVTIFHHLISQAGWNRCNLSIYLSGCDASAGTFAVNGQVAAAMLAVKDLQKQTSHPHR